MDIYYQPAIESILVELRNPRVTNASTGAIGAPPVPIVAPQQGSQYLSGIPYISTGTMGDLDIVHIETVASLGDPTIEVVRPFQVAVEALADDNYVASSTHPIVAASGETPGEALENWRESAALTFHHYSSFDVSELSQVALQTLNELRTHIRR